MQAPYENGIPLEQVCVLILHSFIFLTETAQERTNALPRTVTNQYRDISTNDYFMLLVLTSARFFVSTTESCTKSTY